MEWRDNGAVLSVRKHGETSAIVEVFTESHGRHAGVVRGGVSRKMTPHIQPGAQISVLWRARLEDHIGTFTVEPLRSRAGIMAEPLALAALGSVTALLTQVLPEREAHPYLHAESTRLLDRLGADPAWPLAYLHWEVSLLEEVGFALDLSRCAVTGSRDDLAYVSPRTGRAVSREGAGAWADRLLPLPPCLLGQSSVDHGEIARALGTTGYFLGRILAELADKPLPASRERFIDRLSRTAP